LLQAVRGDIRPCSLPLTLLVAAAPAAADDDDDIVVAHLCDN